MHEQNKVLKLSGFTIVELLIVIVVIAILAVISIVTYSGIQNRTNDSVVQSNLADFAKKIEMYEITEGQYPDGTNTALDALGVKIATGSYDISTYNFYYCVDKADHSAWAIVARSKSLNTFYVSSQGSGNLGKVAPSWNTSCGVIGYTNLTDIFFNYSYDRSVGIWRYGT